MTTKTIDVGHYFKIGTTSFFVTVYDFFIIDFGLMIIPFYIMEILVLIM